MTTSIKIICTGVLLGCAVLFPAWAADQADDVAHIMQELEKTQPAPAVSPVAAPAATETGVQDSAAPLSPAVDQRADTARLEQELKAAKSKISELEEQLFVATDGKGVKGQEVIEELPEGTYPWTENMRRMPIGVLFPKTATIPKGDVYARFSHTSQNQTFAKGAKGDPFNDLLGLESGVKVGILFGYGITKNWDVTMQRTNGRRYTRKEDSVPGSYDLWDVMTKVKLLDESKQFMDLSTSLGGTYFWQDDGKGLWAGNAALLAEKSFWRFRAGSGLLYTSRSDFETATTTFDPDKAANKLYPNEKTTKVRPQNHTMAIPVSLSFALTKSQQLFGEMAFPVDGYEADFGPSVAAGWRYNTHTHAYSIYLSNNPNGSYNSGFTGGYKDNTLDLFGFDISIFF